METRRFGRTGHMSTVAILGGAAFTKVDQITTDTAMKLVLDRGINHIDIAPSYGHAENRLSRWMKNHRKEFFLGCKTMKRTEKDAQKELEGSLRRLAVEHFDLYQLHAVKTMDDLEKAARSGGALDALIKARDKGFIRFIGITGHGVHAPSVFYKALNRFGFDSVLFPVNFIQFAIDDYRRDAEALLDRCKKENVGVMMIKSICKGPWGEKKDIFHTWYEPFTESHDIQKAVSFALTQNATGICTAGDTRLLGKLIDACEKYSRFSESEISELYDSTKKYEPLFT